MDWEKALPLMPWTSWIYVSDYLYPFLIGMLLQSDLITTRVCFAFFIQTIIANTSFFLFPVTFPRDLWPGEPTDYLLNLVRGLDAPSNCFPSCHVAIVILTYLAWQRERPKNHWGFFVWAILICISTLTTKQHYFVDVLAGTVLGIFSYVVAERLIVKSQSS
jgi:membrane-associated phospholipid phosphatase